MLCDGPLPLLSDFLHHTPAGTSVGDPLTLISVEVVVDLSGKTLDDYREEAKQRPIR